MKITTAQLRQIIREEISKVPLNEAEEIDFNALKPQQQKQVQAFEKIIGGKSRSIFGGIHGMIVFIESEGIAGKHRFYADTMKKLLAAKARWVEGGKNTVHIGF